MKILLLSMLGAFLWGQPPAQTPQASPASDPVVFEAGGRRMTRSEFDALMRNLPENVRAQLGPDSPEGRRRLAEQLGEIMSYAAEARRLQVPDKPAVKVQLFLQQESTLASLLYQHFMETARPSEQQLDAYYKAHKGEFETARARHILVRFQGSRVPVREGQKDLTAEEALARAQALRQRILKGEDFAEVARAESDDTGSGRNGGDLGSFGRGRMIAEFEDAVFTLPVGEVSQPVKTQFGYHLIQVQERSVQPLAEVRADIEKRLTTENAQKAMESVKQKGRVFLDESYFGKAAPPADVPAPAQPKP
ncbi:MAG: peptidylprolyl isomerase [Bryobacteraceae bacterium]|nr:peptidylprolyl isomerase [Bryobacteraceae bacterium]